MTWWLICVALLAFLAGLNVGFYLSTPEAPKAKPSLQQTDLWLKEWDGAGVPMRPFRLRRSWKDTRIQWEAEHNTKAQRNASLQDQIRKAKEGTLR